MAYTYTKRSNNRKLWWDSAIRQDSGIITTDAVAQPTTTLTGGAGSANNLAVAASAGFKSQEAIQIPGAGTAAANLFTYIRAVPDGVKISIPQQNAIVTAVAAVNITSYYRIITAEGNMRRPKSVKLTNLNTGIRYEWYHGMAQNSAIKIAADGTMTQLTEDGIGTNAMNFVFSPTMLGVNEKMIYEVSF